MADCPVGAKRYYSRAGTAVLQRLLDTIVSTGDALNKHSWDFTRPDAIDFTEIYRRHYEASKVPELFDELVAMLERIISGGEIDSKQVEETLQRLVNTIRKNSRGDLLAVRGANEVTRSVVKNVVFELLKTLPIVKQLAPL